MALVNQELQQRHRGSEHRSFVVAQPGQPLCQPSVAHAPVLAYPRFACIAHPYRTNTTVVLTRHTFQKFPPPHCAHHPPHTLRRSALPLTQIFPTSLPVSCRPP